MKSLASLATVALLAVSAPALAVPVPIATVGGADTLVHWARLSNSSDASELAFIGSYLGVPGNTLTYNHLSDGASGGSAWDTVIGDSSLYAFNFGAVTPAYFLIKTGNGVGVQGQTGTFTHFLYENVAGLSWGVIDLDLFTRDRGQVEIKMVSHVSTAGTARSVPEPGTLGLMGLALLGAGLARRRKQNA